jgi:hypothetical protein
MNMTIMMTTTTFSYGGMTIYHHDDKDNFHFFLLLYLTLDYNIVAINKNCTERCFRCTWARRKGMQSQCQHLPPAPTWFKTQDLSCSSKCAFYVFQYFGNYLFENVSICC